MSVSPQEKDKLRKRLQKLFHKEERLKEPAAGTSQQSKNKTTNLHKSKPPKFDLINSHKKKPQQCDESSFKVAPMQNGHGKPTATQNSNSKRTKSKNFVLKNDLPKLYKKSKVTAMKANEKLQSPNNSKTLSKQKQNSTEKQNKSNKVPKKTTKNKDSGKKSQGKLENTKHEDAEKQKAAKSKMKPQPNKSVSQAKKAKKRAGLNNAAVSNKKPKLIQKPNKKDIKNKKISKVVTDESDSSSSSQYENEYDVDHMMGCVPGGDFDSDSDAYDNNDSYWIEEDNYGEHDSEAEDDDMVNSNWLEKHELSENDSEEDTANYSMENENIFAGDDSSNELPNKDTAMRKFKKYPKEFSESEQEYYDSDNDFEPEYYDSDSLEEEEEDEQFSDYDEYDYEEEDDSFDYSSESDSEFYTNYNDFEDGNDYSDDEDYELPKHIPEDLIIHKGTCTKHDLKPDDNVSFDSDNDELQIVELENQQSVKIIKQPKEYDKAELLKLKFEEKTLSSTTFQRKEATPSDDEECPKLVPIVDEDGFQLYHSNEHFDDEGASLENYEVESMAEYEDDDDLDDVSLGSEYTEIDSDDAASLLSEDINEKYLKRCNDVGDSDDNVNETAWLKKHKADVIDATGYKYENTLTNPSDHSEASLNDDQKQIPSVDLYKNVDLKTECSILSTTIIDNEIHFTNDRFDQALRPTSIESLETEEEEEDEDISASRAQELNDSETSSEKESPNVIKPHPQQTLATKNNTKFFNALNSNLVIVLLKDPFYIYGTVRLTLLAGSMEVYGHTLKLNTEVELFSPRGCSVIELSSQPTNNNVSTESLQEILKSYEQHFALNDLKTLCSLYQGETDAVVVLKRNEERKKVVQQYKKFMNENVFPNINNLSVDRPLYNTQYLLRCIINTSAQEQKCLRLPKEWQEFKLSATSRVMLAGGKSVGKSTLLRYLINRHLPQKVLLIDLDIGQPEVFVPQTVSCSKIEQPLLGPGFLLNLQPEISFAVGHTNIALCAHKYLSAVRSLIAYCREQAAFQNIPWLINTMGYSKGFGLELISVLVQEPLTDVIQLQSSKEANNFESTLQAHVLSNVPHILFSEEYERVKEEIKENWNYRLHVWPSAVQQTSRYQKEWEMSAKDFRFAILLARLSEALQGHAEWLTDVKPLSASLNDLKIINLLDNTPTVSAEELENSIEANLVYLCHYEADFKPLKCFGIGIVRAVDFHVRHLYLIPALPYKQLKDVNCLAIGEMPLPTSLFTNQGPRVKNMAPFLYDTVAASASKAIKQIYHRPAKFLKGKHKSLN